MGRLLGPIVKARFYRWLAGLLGQQRAAAILRTSRPNLANAIRLLQLEPEILALVSARKLNFGAARALLAVDDPDERADLARLAAAQAWSVRRVEQEVAWSHG